MIRSVRLPRGRLCLNVARAGRGQVCAHGRQEWQTPSPESWGLCAKRGRRGDLKRPSFCTACTSSTRHRRQAGSFTSVCIWFSCDEATCGSSVLWITAPRSRGLSGCRPDSSCTSLRMASPATLRIATMADRGSRSGQFAVECEMRLRPVRNQFAREKCAPPYRLVFGWSEDAIEVPPVASVLVRAVP